LYLAVATLLLGASWGKALAKDVVIHLAMIHNLSSTHVYSLNGVYWTLGVEEQLYLAYFVLLFLRNRVSWRGFLLSAFAVRRAWFAMTFLIYRWTGRYVPHEESAFAHWFEWSLGALSVEAWLGLVKLPRMWRDMRVALVFLVGAAACFHVLQQPASIPRGILNALWIAHSPLWGLGFFAMVNAALTKESEWQRTTPRWIAVASWLGLISYSLYLVHEIPIQLMNRFQLARVGPSALTMVILLLVELIFAAVFFVVAERPFLNAPRRENMMDEGPRAAHATGSG
jgi:peptidoglycan/LPS O-acetylase OafA/YrhL